MIFYKTCLKEQLVKNYIPGTVTNDIKEVIKWYNRYNSKNKKGASKHINKKGTPVIIQFEYDENLLSDKGFQFAGVSEHNRINCWTSIQKQKAQINTTINNYKIIDINTIIQYWL